MTQFPQPHQSFSGNDFSPPQRYSSSSKSYSLLLSMLVGIRYGMVIAFVPLLSSPHPSYAQSSPTASTPTILDSKRSDPSHLNPNNLDTNRLNTNIADANITNADIPESTMMPVAIDSLVDSPVSPFPTHFQVQQVLPPSNLLPPPVWRSPQLPPRLDPSIRRPDTPSNSPVIPSRPTQPSITPQRPTPTYPSLNQGIEQYQLSRGDRIYIDVFDAPEYSGEHQLFTDGTVSLPLVGSFRLQGLTLTQAETLIAQRLSRILRRPFTTIRLLEARPISLAITGEVYSPGAYTFSLAETNGVPTVTKAIQLAQGIRLSADIRNIQIQRRNPLTNQVDERFVVDLWALLSDGDLSQDIILEDGDSIVIPQATDLNYEEVNILAYANISPEQMTVNVVGEVESPGAVQMKPNTPLHQALLAAGGFTNRARKKEVILIRLNPDGTVNQQEIEVDFAQSIDSDGNPPLRPFDTIVVGRSNFAKVTDVLDRALSSVARIIGVLSIFGL